jgi:hypothetical protein
MSSPERLDHIGCIITGGAGIVGVEAFSWQLMSADHTDAVAIWRNRFIECDALATDAMALIRRCGLA